MSKPVCAATPSSAAAEADDDVAQRAVVDVEHAPPGDVVRVEAERVALEQDRLSIIAASRLFAAVTAWKSPVRCRLSCSIGTTWL